MFKGGKLIKLSAGDLNNSYGFEDGFACFEFLNIWAGKSAFKEIWENNDNYSHFYIESRSLLVLLLDRYLAPRLEAVFYNSLEFTSNANNPVVINHDTFFSNAGEENIDYKGGSVGLDFDVEVDFESLQELANELYPKKGKGYLLLFRSMMLNLPGEAILSRYRSERILENYPSLLLRRILTEMENSYSDQEFEIVSHLYYKVDSIEEFSHFFKLSRVL